MTKTKEDLEKELKLLKIEIADAMREKENWKRKHDLVLAGLSGILETLKKI